MRKIVSIVLALAMIFSLSVPAFADTVTSTESGNSASASVKANYTPSTTTTDEAKWGASASSLNIGSGTLEQAFSAAESDSTVKYIQLQTNVTATSNYRITGGSFTLDLNGNSITVDNYYSIEVNSATVTFADSVGTGKVEATGVGGAAVFVTNGGTVTVTGGSYKGGCTLKTMDAATITIKDGSFTTTGEYAISTGTGSTLTIEGGTFTGGSWASVATSGTTKISGGSFAAGTFGYICYFAGTLDLSSYNGTTAITDLTVQNETSSAVTVGNDTIKLPEGYAFYKSDDADKTAVTELAAGVKYAIKSTSGGTTTTDEAKWGASASSLTGSGTLAQAFTAAAASSDVKYIQLQTNVTATTTYVITGGAFTLDLNGKTITYDSQAFRINSGSVTFADNSQEKTGEVIAAETYAIVAFCGTLKFTGGKYQGGSAAIVVNPVNASVDVTISGGTFTATDEDAYAVRIDSREGATMSIEGGTFNAPGKNSYAVSTNGTLTVKGGSFSGAGGAFQVNWGTTTFDGTITSISEGSTGHLKYVDGKVDLTGYQSAAGITELTVYDWDGNVPVGKDGINLPTGYGFYAADDESKTIVTTLSGGKYAIKSTTGGTTAPDEAKWGASASSLTGSGTLEGAFTAAASDSSIKYIQLQTNITSQSTYYIEAGSFTLDLNGKTVSSSTYAITIGDSITNANSNVDITFTDGGSGGKVESTNSASPAIMVKCGKVTFNGGSYGRMLMEFSGNPVPYANVTIHGGSFASDNDIIVSNRGGTLTITGGTFSGDTGVCTAGTTTITGGTFTASIRYVGGKLDLSGYPTTAATGTTALTDLTVRNSTSSAVTVSDDTIKLPAGYAFYKSGDANKATVTELVGYTKYGIKSTSGGTTDTATITGISVKVGETTYTTGTVTLTSTSGDVTFIVTGTNFDKLSEKNVLLYAGGNYKGYVTSDYGWVIDTTNNTASCSIPLAQFAGCITAEQIRYTNNYAKDSEGNELDSVVWTNSGIYTIYQADPISVDILWGSLSFTYSDETSSWSGNGGADGLSVCNNGSTTITASVGYTPAADYSDIAGSFMNITTGNPVEGNSATLAQSDVAAFRLVLTGKPTAALDGATIGQVTVTITKASS